MSTPYALAFSRVMTDGGAVDFTGAGSDPQQQTSRKRLRMEGTGRHVFVSCFDDPDKLVEVDMSLLEPTGCRLSLSINNSQGELLPSGRRVFRGGNTLTRPMLLTMLKSISLGHLVLSKGATIGEAIRVFDYEGISLGSEDHSTVFMPVAGISFTKREESVSESMALLCERVADAIVQWPRLEAIMNSIMPDKMGQPWLRTAHPADASMFTATATRAWLRFADRPKNDHTDGDAMVSLATKNPRWLVEGLVALGIVHNRMSSLDSEFGRLRDEASFKKLYEQVEADPLYTFYHTRFDNCKSNADAKVRREITKGERFCAEVRNAVLNPDSEIRPYARAAMMLVDYHRKVSPLCGRIFSGLCADDSGQTPERNMLKRALKARGITVVKWMEHRDPQIRPIVFPPSWRDCSNASCYGPSVLLGFENVM
jgi:hypothetical protein